MLACEVLARSVDVAFVHRAGLLFGGTYFYVINAAVEPDTSGVALTADADLWGVYSAKRLVDVH